MARLESYPYVADDLKPQPGFEKYKHVGIRPEANEYYHDIVGFQLDHPNDIDYELSFVMGYIDGKMVKRACVLKMTYSELEKLGKVITSSGI